MRASQSAWAFVPTDEIERGLSRLRAELASGAWDRRYGTLRTRANWSDALRLVVAG